MRQGEFSRGKILRGELLLLLEAVLLTFVLPFLFILQIVDISVAFLSYLLAFCSLSLFLYLFRYPSHMLFHIRVYR